MASGPLRDTETLRSGIERWSKASLPDPYRSTIIDVVRPSSGWSNETVIVEYASSDPIVRPRLVVRLPPLVPSYPEYRLLDQAAVHAALSAAPFRVAAVAAVERDEAWLGSEFIAMEYVHGRPLGEIPALDQWLQATDLECRRRVHDGFVGALVGLHTAVSVRDQLTAVLRRGLDRELAYWSDYLDWAADGAPAERLVAALEWCRSTRPQHQSDDVLLWGDARLGNVMFDDVGEVVALLDWELATIGPPEMDLGWFLALTALTNVFVRDRVEGFPDRAGCIAAYEARLGRPTEHLAWHEVFALVRSLAVNDRQARLAAQAGTRYPGAFGNENPILDYIERRIERFA